MNYQVLARKYRPQRFADVAGQQHVTVTLMNALEQGRVAHGYIFSGHRGIGKTTIARILAMALNCRNLIGSELRPTAEPCEMCESCTEIRAGNAVDVIEVDAATNRGIDEIRELRDAARYRPARDRYKIYILDEAHQITDAAFNALLKTLEEPPDHIVFMMATTQPEDIPQTVRSRCQHFSFRAVRLDDILGELRSIATSENLDVDDAALNLIAEAGDGSMRDALSVMDQAIASAPTVNGRANLNATQIRELLGTVSNVVFERMLEAIDGGRSADLITTANELMDAGNSPALLARQLVRYLRSALFAKIVHLVPESEESVGTELLQISVDERRRAARSAQMFTEEELTRFMQVMLRTFDDLGYRQEQRLHFELGLLKLVHLRRLLPIEELLSQLPSSGSSKPASSRAALPASPLQIAPPRSSSAGNAPRLSNAPPAALEQRGASTPEPERTFSPFEADQRRKAQEPAEPLIEQLSSDARPEPDASAPRERAQVIDVSRPAQDLQTQTREATATRAPIAPPGDTAGSGISKDKSPASDGDVTPTPHTAAPAGAEAEVGRLRAAVLDALGAARGQSSALDALAEAEWSLESEVVRAQTGFSKGMLAVILNAGAQQVIREALASARAGLRFEALPAAAERVGEPAKRTVRSAKAGSAQARAQQHPIVQAAQRLFNAEIRNVIDLSDGK